MQQHAMADLACAAGQDPFLLLRRPRGEAVYPQVASAVQDADEGELVVLTFSENQDCDASFIDETLVTLAQNLVAGEFGEKGVALAGLNEGASLTLASTMLLRRDDAKKEGREFKAVFIIFTHIPKTASLACQNWSIVGHLEQSLLDVLHLLAHRESLSAADLVQELGLEISSASMRLKRLHERHLVRREYQTMPTGREYIYAFWK